MTPRPHSPARAVPSETAREFIPFLPELGMVDMGRIRSAAPELLNALLKADTLLARTEPPGHRAVRDLITDAVGKALGDEA